MTGSTDRILPAYRYHRSTLKTVLPADSLRRKLQNLRHISVTECFADGAVKTTWSAPQAARIFMLFKGNKMWKADTIMYHSSRLQTHTKKMFSNCNSLYSGFPVHHESAYEAFHRGNHTCRAISGGGDLLLIFRGIGTKRAGGSTTHSLHWEDWFDPFDVDLLLKVKTKKGKWKCRNWSSFFDAFATSRFLFIYFTDSILIEFKYNIANIVRDKMIKSSAYFLLCPWFTQFNDLYEHLRDIVKGN